MTICDVRINSACDHAHSGYTRFQIMKKFNVSDKTLTRWYKKVLDRGDVPPIELWPPTEYIMHHALIAVRDFPGSTPSDLVNDLSNIYSIEVTQWRLKILMSKLRSLKLLVGRKNGRKWTWTVSSSWNSARPPGHQQDDRQQMKSSDVGEGHHARRDL